MFNSIRFKPITGFRSLIHPLNGASQFSRNLSVLTRQSQSCALVTNRTQWCCKVKGVELVVRHLQTSPRRDAIPPVILVALTRVAKFVGMFVGRSLRIWWRKLPPEERAKYGKKVTRNRYIMGGILGGISLGSWVYYDSHLQTTPFTNRKRFLAFTDEQFNTMSKFELEMMIRLHKDKIIPASLNLSSYRRVVTVAQHLLKANQDLAQIHDKEWTITVVDDPHNANAFVLPCGNIFVFSGLLALCETDDELAVILGHEMAHAVMGHGAEKASFLHFLDLLMVIPLAALWAILPTDLIAGLGSFVTNMVTTLVMELPHSRFIEEEADQVGLILAAKACFDIRHCLMLWEKMGLMGNHLPGTEDLNLEWLSTHPSHDKRLQQLEDLLPSALTVREKCHCPRLPFYDGKAEVLRFEAKLKKNKKHPHEGLLLPVKVH